MNDVLPESSRVVVIGGGIVGCSVAYHLAKFGWKDVTVLEQNRIGGGTTWHAAGLVGRLRTSSSMTQVNRYSAELYAGLERETGHSVGWNQVGSLMIATHPDRMTQLRRTTAMAALFGVETHMLGPDEVRKKWPLLNMDGVLGGAWLPHDGKVIPGEVPLALVKGARARGAAVVEHVGVLGLERKNGRVTGVQTNRGVVRAEQVVLCGGMWARQFGLQSGVNIPLYPVEHHYIVSEPIAGASDDLPVCREPDSGLYFRSEGGGIMLGAFQRYTKPWMIDRVPDDFSFQLLEADWDKFAEPLAAGKHRIPALAAVKWSKFVNGPESFTPDNNFILGEAPELRNLFVAAGFNSAGIASAGGAGKLLAEWIMEGRAPCDLWSVDPRRFGPAFNNTAFLRERVTEVLGLHYQMAWPNREFETGRGLRKSPLHDRLLSRGAVFGSKNGWERPNWFARDGVEPVTQYAFGRQNWFESHRHEHEACRRRVAIFDQTGFSKFILKGRDALTVLQRLCGNDVDVPVGRTVYTGLFNETGTFESDLTVLRQGHDQFYILTATAQTVRDLDWIARHIRPDEHAELVDVTTGWSVIGVMGPDARRLLQSITDSDLDNDSFPFATARRISIGHATVWAVRLSYVGELGWELNVSMDQVQPVYDALTRAGRDFDAADAGHYAINSLRLEKGFRAWGAELTPDDTPLEAGLGFAVAWDKPDGFLGRDALLRQKESGVTKRMATFALDDPDPMLWGGEPIYRNGAVAGYTTSGAYGHTVGAAVAMGYVKHSRPIPSSYIREGRYEIETDGIRVPATAHLRAPYDPKRERLAL